MSAEIGWNDNRPLREGFMNARSMSNAAKAPQFPERSMRFALLAPAVPAVYGAVPPPDARRCFPCSCHQVQIPVRFSTASFSNMCWTCFFTVCTLHPQIPAISSLRLLQPIHSATSSSRGVSGFFSSGSRDRELAFRGPPCGWRLLEGIGGAPN